MLLENADGFFMKLKVNQASILFFLLACLKIFVICSQELDFVYTEKKVC